MHDVAEIAHKRGSIIISISKKKERICVCVCEFWQCIVHTNRGWACKQGCCTECKFAVGWRWSLACCWGPVLWPRPPHCQQTAARCGGSLWSICIPSPSTYWRTDEIRACSSTQSSNKGLPGKGQHTAGPSVGHGLARMDQRGRGMPRWQACGLAIEAHLPVPPAAWHRPAFHQTQEGSSSLKSPCVCCFVLPSKTTKSNTTRSDNRKETKTANREERSRQKCNFFKIWLNFC